MGLMKILSSLFSGKEDAEEENRLIDVDEEGKQLYKQDIIQFVVEELEKRKRERSPLEQQWTLQIIMY